MPGGTYFFTQAVHNRKANYLTVHMDLLRIAMKKNVPILKNSRGEYNLWQKRYWEHTIKDEEDLEAHIDYIHYNPVKHKLVTQRIDWPYSSFHLYVRKNLLPPHWGDTDEILHSIDFGE